VPAALSKLDTSGILFFLGILMSIGALDQAGLLAQLAVFLNENLPQTEIIATVIGIASALIDNVPLVAATMGMYNVDDYAMDDNFWQLIALCAGTGGSILVIGSASGVALMGLEKVDFLWYAKNVSVGAAVGYFAGIATYVRAQRRRAQRKRVLLRRKRARSADAKKACPSAAEAGCFARGLEGARAKRAQPKSVPLRRKRAVSLGGQGVSLCGGSGLLRSGVVGGRPPEPPLLPARSKCAAPGPKGPPCAAETRPQLTQPLCPLRSQVPGAVGGALGGHRGAGEHGGGGLGGLASLAQTVGDIAQQAIVF
jgi:hypothetical protein